MRGNRKKGFAKPKRFVTVDEFQKLMNIVIGREASKDHPKETELVGMNELSRRARRLGVISRGGLTFHRWFENGVKTNGKVLYMSGLRISSPGSKKKGLSLIHI